MVLPTNGTDVGLPAVARSGLSLSSRPGPVLTGNDSLFPQALFNTSASAFDQFHSVDDRRPCAAPESKRHAAADTRMGTSDVHGEFDLPNDADDTASEDHASQAYALSQGVDEDTLGPASAGQSFFSYLHDTFTVQRKEVQNVVSLFNEQFNGNPDELPAARAKRRAARRRAAKMRGGSPAQYNFSLPLDPVDPTGAQEPNQQKHVGITVVFETAVEVVLAYAKREKVERRKSMASKVVAPIKNGGKSKRWKRPSLSLRSTGRAKVNEDVTVKDEKEDENAAQSLSVKSAAEATRLDLDSAMQQKENVAADDEEVKLLSQLTNSDSAQVQETDPLSDESLGIIDLDKICPAESDIEKAFDQGGCNCLSFEH